MTEKEKPSKPFVILELDKPRKFRLTLNALVELEERVGLKISDPSSFLTKLNNFSTIRQLLYLGLADDNPDIKSEKQVGKLIEWQNLEKILDKVMPFLGVSKKTKNVERVTPQKRKNPGTGTPPSKRHAQLGSSRKNSTS